MAIQSSKNILILEISHEHSAGTFSSLQEFPLNGFFNTADLTKA